MTGVSMSDSGQNDSGSAQAARAIVPLRQPVLRARWFNISTLRRKLLLSFVAVAVLPLALMTYLDYRTTRAELTRVNFQSLFAAASQTAMRLDSFIDGNLDIVGTEAQVPLLATYLTASVAQRQELAPQVLDLLSTFSRRDTRFIQSYALLDINGRNLIDFQPANIGSLESGHDYFHVALKTQQPYASRVEFSDGQAHFHLSSAVRAPKGGALGVLRGRYNAAVLQDMVAEHNELLGPRSFAFVLNEDRIFLAYGPLPPDRLSEKIYKSLTSLTPARAAELQASQRLPRRPPNQLSVDLPDLAQNLNRHGDHESTFTAEIPDAGKGTYAAAISQLITQPWLVVFVEPQDVLLAPVLKKTRAMTTLAFVMLALVAVVAIVTAQLLTRPIVRLTAVARQVAEGNIGAKADVTTYDEIGILARTFNFMTDKLKETVDGLRRSEAKFRDTYEYALEGIYQATMDGKLLSANPAMARLLGYESSAELAARIGNISELYVHPEAREALVLPAILERGVALGLELEVYRKDRTTIWISVNARIARDENGNPVFIEGFVTDITERKRAQDHIRYLAQHDALTGLPTRVVFRDRIALALAQARRENRHVAVLFIDLDHFKHINDSLGHQVGDRLLRAVAARLQHCLREVDSVARLGGDEFVIGLPGIDTGNDAASVARKAIEALTRPLTVDEHELHISASIGISFYPTDGEDVDALMRAADTAMYHAKEKGRNNYQFFTSVLNEAAQSRLLIANRLHHALARGEFFLCYQPQVDLETGRVFAVEALIRWDQPEMGTIAPSQFVRVAEETGAIFLLGEWVLREACAQLVCWRKQGYPEIRVAVNLSPQQLRRPGFPDFAARTLREAGLTAPALQLELTESTLMVQGAENIEILERLAGMGVELAVDDFGTGYSSLSDLQRFPIHTLKIDQSFIRGIGEDANDTAIVTAVIAMADSLGLNVVAEGVETAAQAVFLRQHGCLAAQGFYFSRPMSADALNELLGKQRQSLNLPQRPPNRNST